MNKKRKLLIGMSAITTGTVWHKPIVRSVLLPSHAENTPLTTPPDGSTPTTTPTPTTTAAPCATSFPVPMRMQPVGQATNGAIFFGYYIDDSGACPQLVEINPAARPTDFPSADGTGMYIELASSSNMNASIFVQTLNFQFFYQGILQNNGSFTVSNPGPLTINGAAGTYSADITLTVDATGVTFAATEFVLQ